MTTTEDRTVASFLLQNGGLSERAIGCKFRGKKPGTWREVTRVRFSRTEGATVRYIDQDGRTGGMFVSSFLTLSDRYSSASLPGKDFQDDDTLPRTVRMLRDRGYSREDIVRAFDEIGGKK